MDLEALRTRVLERVDEDALAPTRYSADLVDQFINDGVQLWARKSKALFTTTTLTRSALHYRHQLPDDCLRVISVKDDANDFLLEASHFKDFDEPGWDGKWTNPRVHRRWLNVLSDRATNYFLFGMDEIWLWPMHATGTDTYTVTYQKDAGLTSLESDTDEPDFPEEYHHHIVDYAVARCLVIQATGKRLEKVTQALTDFALAAIEAGAATDNRAVEFAGGPRS
jgi:hypothetical protein